MKSIKLPSHVAIAAVAIVAAAIVTAGCANTRPAKHEGPLKVLAVGNSFSINATRQLPGIAKAAGRDLQVVNASIGGCDFERHMRHANIFENDPDGKDARPYGGKSLKEMLAQDKWDVVTIQQASPKSFRPETFHPHADNLIAYIRKNAPQAEIVIHQTWAYREDHKFWGDTNLNTDVMYSKIRSAYDGLAKDMKLRQIPSGDAMQAARQYPAWGPFMAGDPPAPAEARSLHSGDAYHANVKGEYLQGCVWFESLFGESVIGNTFVPKGMTAEETAILQRIAHRVVTKGKRPALGRR